MILLVTIGLVSLCICLKLFCFLTHVNYTPKVRLDGKTVIITGANAGIGKETAIGIANTGARVIMACRNLKLGEEARRDIIAATGNPAVVLKHLDLSSFQSIREFADDINRTEDRLDVLVHNAGYAGSFTSAQSVDGLELTMATNHYGPFLLTHLLIDLLKRSKPSRIVVVSSILYCLGRVDLKNLNPLTVLPGYLYYVSKRANILFTQELARRLAADGGVTANSLHPGLIDTGIWRNVKQPAKTFISLCNLFAKTMREGAQTSIYASTEPELETVNGEFFAECRAQTQDKHDPLYLIKFWEQSVSLCGLEASDPKI